MRVSDRVSGLGDAGYCSCDAREAPSWDTPSGLPSGWALQLERATLSPWTSTPESQHAHSKRQQLLSQ